MAAPAPAAGGSAEARMAALLSDYYGITELGESDSASGSGCDTDSERLDADQRRKQEPHRHSSIASMISVHSTKASDRGHQQDVDHDEADADADSPLDSPDFDANAYLQHLLRTSTLEDLVHVDNGLSAEVRSLDSDLQMLVYENYNKFISATDVIGAMQTQMQSMYQDMLLLRDTMSSLKESYDNANQRVSSSRSRLSELVSVQRLLARLQFLFDLPRRLRQCVNDGRYDEAVQLYVSSSRIIEAQNYAHVRSFHTIRAECQHIVATLKSHLRANLTSSAMDECMKSASMLLQLDEPADLLVHSVLEKSRDHLLLQISPEAEHLQRFAHTFVELATSFRGTFVAKATPQALEALTLFTVAMFDRYFHEMETVLDRHVSALKIADLKQHLQAFKADVDAVHGLVPEAKLREKAMALCDRSIKQCITAIFSSGHNDIVNSLQNLSSQVTPSPPDASFELEHLLRERAKDLLERVEVALQTAQSFSVDDDDDQDGDEAVSLLVRTSFVAALHDVVRVLLCTNLLPSAGPVHSVDAATFERNHELFELVSPAAPATTTGSVSMLMLCLSRLSLHLAECLPDLFETAAIKFPARQHQKLFDSQCSRLVSQLMETSQVLLGAIARVQGDSLAQRLVEVPSLRDADAPALAVEKPVRSWAWAEALLDMYQLYSTMYREVSQSAIVRFDAASRRVRPPLRRNDIERLFSQRVVVFGRVDSNMLSLVFAALVIALKSFVEHIRERPNGDLDDEFQQLQVDVHSIRLHLPPALSTDDRSVLESLLDEVLTTAIEQCSDAVVLLSPEGVESICRDHPISSDAFL